MYQLKISLETPDPIELFRSLAHFMMQLSSLALLGISALCLAISLPDNITDGVFAVTTDDNGNEIHERISGPIVTLDNAPPPHRVDGSRDVSTASRTVIFHTWCGCGIGLDHGQCDAAVADLKNQLGRNAREWWTATAWYSIRGGVVAFACNPGSGRTWAADFLVGETLEAVTKKCGWYIAGTGLREVINSGDDEALIGYMRHHPGLDFCKASTSSPVNHC